MTPAVLIDLLLENKYSFITGVPDSVFKHFLMAVDVEKRFQHIITNNEGESCSLAAGYHLATGKVPIVYMQNSGLGNSINPLTSLLDENIYAISALLMIAWRGLPGEKDEPQHKKMGEILPGMLSLLGIPFSIADSDPEKMKNILQYAAAHFNTHQKPYAILFPKTAFQASKQEKNQPAFSEDSIVRERLLEFIVKNTLESDVIITTTGKTSRELYEIRERTQKDHSKDFLTIGSMGCASSIALGIAMECKNRRVILVDGDGACLMRMEALATIGHIRPPNLLHIVLDNNAYESTGSQKTLSGNVDFSAIAMACNYRSSVTVNTLTEFREAFAQFDQGPTMIVTKTIAYSRPDLGRPKSTPIENKRAFMKRLGMPV